MRNSLFPTQQQTFDRMLRQLPAHAVVEILGNSGSGKSTLLHYAHHHLGGELLQLYDFIDQTRHYHPLALEEAFEQMVMSAFRSHSVVLIDDLQILLQVCHTNTPRDGLLTLPLRKLGAYATRTQKKLVVATDHRCYRLSLIYPETETVRINEFQAIDYGFLCYCYLDDAIAARLDYDKIYRFASNLNAYQLRRACLELN
uniref:AAA+ ATPase domain-containing protein n=1 Tax=Oscillatoriales cyanobacterium SpSt-402 TaxID=2282168 RepID=A0A832H4D0_9CYAN